MNEKSRTIDDVKFPPMNFYDFIDRLSDDESSLEREEYHGLAYKIWYRKHVVDNHQFNKLISLHDHRAISLFEKIINSHDFFMHIILSLEDYKPLKDFINERFPKLSFIGEEISPRWTEEFTENIIIPEKYKMFSKYQINLFKFLRDNPIKINFQSGKFFKFEKFPSKKPFCGFSKKPFSKNSSKTYSFRSF